MTLVAVDAARLERGRMTRAEAEALTDEIRTHANRLWMLVAIAYERKAWRTLGYDSWKAYVAEELAISESRSYQLVDTGRVMLTIAAAAGVDPASLSPVPARAVARVKDDLPALKRALQAQLRSGEPDGLEDRVAAAIAEVSAHNIPEPVTVIEQVYCPVCDGSGVLGHGRRAESLAQRAERWLRRAR